MSLYEGLEVETVPIPDITIGSIVKPTVSTSSDATDSNKNLSKSSQ